MAGINNKYDYRDGVLTALGVEHTPSDVRNEDEYRKKVLDGFGVEYTDDDINRKHLYREKVVNGLASGGGGGGDFTTANVTITNGSSENSLFYRVPTLVNQSGMENVIAPQSSIHPGITITITAVLGKGGCVFLTDGQIDSVSGNAQKIRDASALITGDCTITIS